MGTSLRNPKLAACVLAVVVLAGTACSEGTKSGSSPSDTSPTSVSAVVVDCKTAPSIVACVPKNSMLAPLLPKRATKATGSPIVLGTINQDTGAAGAFPELTTADKVAVDFINDELNGVDGHPIKLLTCNTNFSPDLSQSCAQQMVSAKVPAVIGGIDVWGTGITTLQNNGIPYVGGIPVSFASARSPVSFQFSGGSWGAVLGLGQYALEELHAKKIAIIYGEFGPITDAAKLGKVALEKRGAHVNLISVSPVNADMVQALNTAAQTKPDALIALTADSGCKPTMLTAKQIGFKAPILYTGACAAPKILDSVGKAAEGSIFNVEGELGTESPDNSLYQAIAQRYGAKYGYEWQSAGTISFRSTMNLYAVLRSIGADKITPAAVLAGFRGARSDPSFFGHPYTCDGHQLEGYPALCAPQQTLGVQEKGVLKPLTDWIDVGSFAR